MAKNFPEELVPLFTSSRYGAKAVAERLAAHWAEEIPRREVFRPIGEALRIESPARAMAAVSEVVKRLKATSNSTQILRFARLVAGDSRLVAARGVLWAFSDSGINPDAPDLKRRVQVKSDVIAWVEFGDQAAFDRLLEKNPYPSGMISFSGGAPDQAVRWFELQSRLALGKSPSVAQELDWLAGPNGRGVLPAAAHVFMKRAGKAYPHNAPDVVGPGPHRLMSRESFLVDALSELRVEGFAEVVPKLLQTTGNSDFEKAILIEALPFDEESSVEVPPKFYRVKRWARFVAVIKGTNEGNGAALIETAAHPTEEAAKAAFNSAARARPGVAKDKPRKSKPALLDAAQFGRSGAMRKLLDAGTDPNVFDRNGFTALFLAARSGNAAVARLMLEHGADPNVSARDVPGLTPLRALSIGAGMTWNELSVATMLLEHGARDVAYEGATASHLAAAAGIPELLESLKANGQLQKTKGGAKSSTSVNWDGHPTRMSLEGKTPLALARAGENHLCVQILES